MVLQDDLLGRMIKLLRRKPARMGGTPVLAAGKDPTMAQKEGEKVLAFLAQILARCGPNPHQIAHRFIDRVRNPNPVQFARPQQPRQSDRVASVGLDALACALGDQRRRNDIAAVAERNDLPVKSVAGRAGFIAEMQARMLLLQLAHEALHRRRRRLDLAEIAHLSFPAPLRNRDRVLGLRHIDTDVKSLIFCHGPSFLCLGLGSALPSNPRLL